MEIEFKELERFVDKLYLIHYFFLFFIIGLVVAGLIIKSEVRSKRNEQLNRIFFGAAKKEDS